MKNWYTIDKTSLPKGHKRWPEYGNVIALNKKNAIKKWKKLCNSK